MNSNDGQTETVAYPPDFGHKGFGGTASDPGNGFSSGEGIGKIGESSANLGIEGRNLAIQKGEDL